MKVDLPVECVPATAILQGPFVKTEMPAGYA